MDQKYKARNLSFDSMQNFEDVEKEMEEAGFERANWKEEGIEYNPYRHEIIMLFKRKEEEAEEEEQPKKKPGRPPKATE